MLKATTKVNLKGLDQFLNELDHDLRAGGQLTGGSPISNAIKQWAVRYRSFIQERFVLFSRGGGDWAPLKPATIKRRRKGRGSGLIAAILRDTNTMFAALNPEFTGKPGAIQEKIPFGVRVGFGGPGRYSKRGKVGKATIADIASFHQRGAGHLPKREIIVEPSQKVVDLMAEDMRRALKRLAEDAKI